jgi:hypothetical protein
MFEFIFSFDESLLLFFGIHKAIYKTENGFQDLFIHYITLWSTKLAKSILAESAFVIADELVKQGFASSRDDVENNWLDAPQFFANRQQSRDRLINSVYVDRLRWRLNFVSGHVPATTRDRVQRILDLIDKAEWVAATLAR